MPPLSIAERWRWWREDLGSPKYICAPMVLQSELAYRMLLRKHGTTLCYSPMLPVAAFLEAPFDAEVCEQAETGGPCTQASWFTTHARDRPLLVQLGGSDPNKMLAAAQIVITRLGGVDGVDINFGCPQRCAAQGGYGAFLMDDIARSRQIVETLVAGLSVPVTAKIRILPSLDDTLAFARMLERAGVACLAVHGRRREQRHHEGPADWSVIAAVKAALSIPVVANGNVRCKADADRCMRETGVDGVMSATALLSNPRLFAGGAPSVEPGSEGILDAAERRAMAREYLDCCEAYPDGALPRIMCDHLLAILRADLGAKEHADLKRLCKDHKGAARSAAVLRTHVVDELERRAAAAAAATAATAAASGADGTSPPAGGPTQASAGSTTRKNTNYTSRVINVDDVRRKEAAMRKLIRRGQMKRRRRRGCSDAAEHADEQGGGSLLVPFGCTAWLALAAVLLMAALSS